MAYVKELIEEAPTRPGVYLMKSSSGAILYVGKAKSLRARLRSYLRDQESARITALLGRVKVVEWILTGNEQEALLLECNLIKQHRPRFNVLFRDDKNFPYLCVDTTHIFPKLSVVRKVKRDGKYYFGPYNQIGSIHEAVRLLNKAFQIRDCTDTILKTATRPCVNYEMGTCTAPCVEKVSEEDYGKQIKQLRRFLNGYTQEVLKTLEKKMLQKSNAEEFEHAALIRNQMQALEKLLVNQHMISTDPSVEMDIFAIAQNPDRLSQGAIGCVNVRGGKVIGFHGESVDISGLREVETTDEVLAVSDASVEQPAGDSSGDRALERRQGDVLDELLATAIVDYYQSNLVPKRILLPPTTSSAVVQALMQTLENVVVTLAKSQEENYHIQFTLRNAQNYLAEHASAEAEAKKVLEDVQRLLHLQNYPRTIECLDVSHHQGEFTIASIVQFQNAAANKAGYRRYNIQSVDNVDDFASVAEVVRRRLTRALEEDHYPDLLVIDGGIGQLNAAAAVFDEMQITQTELASLAKARTEANMQAGEVSKSDERIFRPGRSNPIHLRPGTPAYSVLVQLRNEAHRFAIGGYRHKHGKSLVTSVVEKLKGIGEKRKQRLLTHFDSIEDMLSASPEEWRDLLQCTIDQARDWILALKDAWERSQSPPEPKVRRKPKR
jgi:excinuclease ABC subunit C